ncbi:hypothetical protein MPPM_2605 [Methylorubrum populi]|uniref:OmpR/PhoB-type domain-containing protein n=1 Tax=Methylorubrum populi TaxID=223967 RepID=A0A160PHX2_9HYPH|nr:helix-turn-helix domain-containing protein [Methylorubrum populi]BAU91210.1 hypothetical protein MPPM_2605 [Methylorubrum populi]
MNAHAHHLTRSQVIALLEERDTLRETIRQLEDILVPFMVLPKDWRLTTSEQRMMRALRASAPGILHKERAMIAMYGTWEDAPEQKIVDVFICKIRRKLMEAQTRIHIETIWGRGWRLTPESIQIFDGIVAADAADYPAWPSAERAA